MLDEPVGALTDRSYWEQNKPGVAAGDQSFDPASPIFRAHHRFFREHLDANPNVDLIEIGCHPGQYLWYFHRYFHYHVHGIEYVEGYCAETIANLEVSGISATIVCDDLFEYAESGSAFDLVVSFGFVEHFTDIQTVVDAHWKLVKPGGRMIISVPNHAGLYGWLLRVIDRKLYERHNRMNLAQLKAATERLPALEQVVTGYLGGLGFWNSGLYQLFRTRYPIANRLLTAPFKLMEHAARDLSPSRVSSPNIVAMACKRR